MIVFLNILVCLIQWTLLFKNIPRTNGKFRYTPTDYGELRVIEL
jgi:hypothetical protein